MAVDPKKTEKEIIIPESSFMEFEEMDNTMRFEIRFQQKIPDQPSI